MSGIKNNQLFKHYELWARAGMAGDKITVGRAKCRQQGPAADNAYSW